MEKIKEVNDRGGLSVEEQSTIELFLSQIQETLLEASDLKGTSNEVFLQNAEEIHRGFEDIAQTRVDERDCVKMKDQFKIVQGKFESMTSVVEGIYGRFNNHLSKLKKSHEESQEESQDGSQEEPQKESSSPRMKITLAAVSALVVSAATVFLGRHLSM